MKIQEAWEDLQMGAILFPKFWGKLFEDEDLKRQKIGKLGSGNRHHAPSAWIFQTMRLGHAFCLTHMRLGNLACAPCIPKCKVQPSFPASVLGKARTFSPNPGRNYHYKCYISSFINSRSELWQFKWNATLEL